MISSSPRILFRCVLAASTFLMILALAACGGSGSGPTPPCTTCTPSSSDFVYEANANQVSIFEVDSTTGVVNSTPSPITGAVIPGGMVATSTNYIYVTEAEGLGGVVYGYSADTSSGALTAIPGSPFNTGVSQPGNGMATDPAGKFLFITIGNMNEVAAFTIGSNGALTPVANSPFNTNDTTPIAAAVDSTGSFLYVSNNMSFLGTISAFTIGSDGSLTALPGSPFTTTSAGGPGNLAVNPKANFLYVPLAGTTAPLDLVAGYSFDSSGALTSISTPYMVGEQPASVLVDPSGKFLFSADFGGNDISAFTIDSSTGALSPVSGSPFAASSNPLSLAINASSSLLFATSGTSTSIFAFTINSSGQLTAVAPLNGGGTSGGLAVIHKQ